MRLREHGHVITGEIFVVARANTELTTAIADAVQTLQAVDWRLHDLTIMPVRSVERQV